MLGQLRDPRAIAIVAVGVDRLRPRRFGEFEDRLADRVAQLVADRETNRGVTAILRERVRLTADVGADQDLAVKVLGRELREREPEHDEVIRGGVRPGVPGPQDRSECFAGLIQPAPQRMKPVPMLVVPGRELLVGVGRQQRRVYGQRDRLRADARVTHPRPRHSARCTNPIQQLRVDRLQHPLRGRLRRASTEQPLS